MIGIIGAMQVEIDGLVNIMTEKEEVKINSFIFYKGLINSKPVVVVKCGIGKVNSASACSIMINTFSKIELVINLGVAGGIKPDIKQGDIVLCEKCVQHDYEATADGLPKGQIHGFDDIYFNCDTIAVEKTEKVLKDCGYIFYKGTIASGDQFINDTNKAKELYKDFNAYACDMETASIAHVCKLLDTKFLAVRAISDNGDDSAVGDFYSFVVKAAERSINIIQKLVAIV